MVVIKTILTLKIYIKTLKNYLYGITFFSRNVSINNTLITLSTRLLKSLRSEGSGQRICLMASFLSCKTIRICMVELGIDTLHI